MEARTGRVSRLGKVRREQGRPGEGSRQGRIRLEPIGRRMACRTGYGVQRVGLVSRRGAESAELVRAGVSTRSGRAGSDKGGPVVKTRQDLHGHGEAG